MSLSDYSTARIRRAVGFTDAVIHVDGLALLPMPRWVEGALLPTPRGREYVRVRLHPKWWAWPWLACQMLFGDEP